METHTKNFPLSKNEINSGALCVYDLICTVNFLKRDNKNKINYVLYSGFQYIFLLPL